MLFRFALVFAVALSAFPVQAQQLWTDLAPSSLNQSDRAMPLAYRALGLDRAGMEALLASAPEAGSRGVRVPLAMPDGSTAMFEVVEASILAPGLQARFPSLRTYSATRVGARSTTARISLTPLGLAAWILSPDGVTVIDPVSGGQHIAYDRADAVAPEAWARDRAAEVFEAEEEPLATSARGGNEFSNAGTLRTYRLAVATTGEYAQFHGGTVASALEAIVVAMNRVNGIYERELSITMELVENNDKIVFTDAATDPYTDGNPGALFSQNPTVLNDSIGTANYDIGHVFSTGGGGVAGLGVVCRATVKAQGVTGLSSPIGDPFYVDYVAHEMGHQFRGNHTFNGSANACGGANRNLLTAFEPGSGSTIMAYAGICGGHNIQSRSDPYFHTASLREIATFVTTGAGSTCGTQEAVANEAPVVTATDSLFVPVLTPFILSGSATDEDPTALTYTWEEVDFGFAGAPAGVAGFNGRPPLFRSFSPADSASRVFPRADRLFAGNAPRIGEALPIDDEILNFRLTVRDNLPEGGGIADIRTVVVVDSSAGRFLVTTPSGPGQTFAPSGPLAVTWDVAGTGVFTEDAEGKPVADSDKVDVETVDILFSPDDGATFTPLALATPNDGAETVTLPGVTTLRARILVRATPDEFGSTFFDIGDFRFSVNVNTASERAPNAGATLIGPWPHPVGRDGARLELSVDTPQAATVTLYDALGRRVRSLFAGPLAAGDVRAIRLETTGLAPGAYVVRVVGETVTLSRPLTVVR